jgi:hypothetical protein
MNSTKKTARLAALLWFLTAVTGGFGYSYVRSSVVPGDAAATAANIMASELLFRTAVVSNLFSQVILLFFGLTLYGFFKGSDRALARTLLASIMLTVVVSVVNALNSFGALLVLSGADYLKAFTPEQLNAAALIFLRLGNFGQGLLEIFWVPYYFSFGLLVIRSGFLPKILGVLLMLMSVGFMVNILDKFLIPQFYPVAFTQLAMTLGALGGIPLFFGLLIKGLKPQSPDEQAS